MGFIFFFSQTNGTNCLQRLSRLDDLIGITAGFWLCGQQQVRTQSFTVGLKGIFCFAAVVLLLVL